MKAVAMAKASPPLPPAVCSIPANLKSGGNFIWCTRCSLPVGFKHPRHKRATGVQAVAPSLPQAVNVDYLEREFSGHGAKFQGIGDSCVVKMALDCGSTASLMLPSGLITSYKPQMWHGSSTEVLQTTVSQGDDGEVVIQGGVSLGLRCKSEDEGLWCPSAWALRDVRGSPESSIQVELVSSDPRGGAEMSYLVTLHQDILGSELTVTNMKYSSLCLMGSVITHLKVSTPDATYAVGLQGSNYQSHPPERSAFSIIPAGFRGRSSRREYSWGQNALRELVSGLGQDVAVQSSKEEEEEECYSEGVEEDNYSQLTESMSRIYTSAPREFTIIDRGRRNSVVIERKGFDELYVFSPGSSHERYGKYAYVCTGPSAVLAPIIVGPVGIWRGAQYVYNPNM